MLIRRQDLSVLLLYYSGYSRIRNQIFRFQRKPVTSFVTFHDLKTEELICFKDNLSFLKQSTNVVSLDDFFLGRLSYKKINTVITFDDGYKSWITDAVPVLKELELPATFFVSSGFIGLSRKDELEFVRTRLLINCNRQRISGCLTVEDVRRIVEEGFAIGGHTVNHSNLAKLRDIVKLRNEIAEDKMRLEQITGKKIEYFAYPSGAYENPVINLTEILSELGYKGAVTTVSGFNGVGSSPYHLHRELTGTSMPGIVFRARVYGNYDTVRFLKECVQMIYQRR